MLKDTIEKFKEKHSGFNFEEFIQSYLDGESRESLCSRYNVSEMPLRGFLARLGLEFPKSRRYNSFEDFKYRISLENNITDVNALVEVENDVKLLAEDNRKLRKALVLARDSNNALRKEVRVEVRNEDVVEHLLEELKQGLHSIEIPTTPFMLVDRSILNNQEAQPFVLLSDTHFNELIEGKYIEDYNEFNNQICLDGIDKLLTKVQRYGGDTLRIYLAGDILSGKIHSLDLKGQLPVTSSIIEMAYY